MIGKGILQDKVVTLRPTIEAAVHGCWNPAGKVMLLGLGLNNCDTGIEMFLGTQMYVYAF